MSQSVLMCDTDRVRSDYGLKAASGGLCLRTSESCFSIGVATSISSPPYPFETKESKSLSLKKLLERLGFISLPLASRGSIFVAPAPGFDLDPGLSPTHSASTDAAPVAITSQGNATSTSSMSPANHGLRPILPIPTRVGDPYGHHEISEPDFTATRPCSGCSTIVLITATGWLDQSTRVSTSSTVQPTSPQAVTIAAGTSPPSASSTSIAIGPDPDGADFAVGGSCTWTPGEAIIVDGTLIGIQTLKGGTEVVISTGTIPLQSQQTHSINTPTPLPPLLTIGTATLVPNAQTQYMIAGQTLVPDGKPLTMSNTTLSLAQSATALVVNGETSSINPVFGTIYTKVVPAALNYNNHVYTVNRAGYIEMGQGATLIPGGTPITINGTTLSLEHSGTAVVIQSTTQTLEPVTTVVTLTRGPGGLETGCGIPRQSTGDVYVYPTTNPVSAGGIRNYGTLPEGWLGSMMLLMWCGIGIILRI
ncbi:hypothetical protein PTTW11_04025 [Pyrenophora teres f. teres]|uniref:Uncharacterized protein n=1 Tax=Pyrenophora teres f. teres TaxID=97479 RepID=A0A6S6VY22_9PLEO|nr:hypothetical protein PTTW11_04025 [Pyrenophora teres f. teres]